MSKKVAIVSDSTGCLSESMLNEYHIFTSYLMIIFGENSYQEFKELSPEKFVELSNAQKELPSTSQPAIGSTVELYEKILADGYDEIVHITISSTMSGSYQSAVSASEMVDSEKIHIFDSKAVAYPQGALAIEAAKLAKAGKNAAEILVELEKLQKNLHLTVAIADLTNLKKGGRISGIQASLASVLQVKPILSVTTEGVIEAVGKVRTFKKAIDFLADVANNAKLDESYEIGILHVANPEGAQVLKSKLQAIYPNITMHDLPLSLVVAVHGGAGAVAVTWIKNKINQIKPQLGTTG